MNDDAAEKASRRKSAHFGDLSVSRKEVEAEKGQGKRVASDTGSGSGTMAREKVRKRLSAVGIAAGVPAPVALEVNSTKFEEWMKLATDNVGHPRVEAKRGSETNGSENHCYEYLEFRIDRLFR
jgi:condensin complex subunit 2